MIVVGLAGNGVTETDTDRLTGIERLELSVRSEHKAERILRDIGIIRHKDLLFRSGIWLLS